jgi:branched-chain amino acid transport system substrate-binding protein
MMTHHQSNLLMRTLAALFIAALWWTCLAPLAQAAEPIKVGLTTALTGELAAPGSAQLQGVEMWADDLNARGALLGRKVQIVHYDDQSDAATCARLYERLITQDKVDLLIGPYSSDLTLAASQVAERNNFPMVTAGAASSRIWSRGYQNVFGVDAPALGYMDLLVDSAARADLKTIALVYAETEFTTEVAEGVRIKAAEHGMRIVLDRAYPEDTSDFTGLVRQIGQAGPDLVIGGTYLNDSIGIMRQAKRQGLSPKAFAFTVGPALREFGDALGPDADGVLGVVSWMPSANVPMAYDFSYRYREKYGHDAGVHAAYGYGAGQVLEGAARLAHSLSRGAVRQQLGTMKFRSLLGNYRVDDTGKQVVKEIYVMQWQEGRRRLVLPKSLREGIIIYPFTPWSER